MKRALSIVGVICVSAVLSAAQAVPQGVITASLKSEALGKEVSYQVVLPEDYEKSRLRYPVLYLLHGYGGHYFHWLWRTNLAEHVRRLPVIVVLPEGENLYYVNSPKGKEEDHIIKELIPAVDHTYRTITLGGGRAIAGLSMGGYGALLLGLKHPELFALAGSFSGGVAAPQSESENSKEIFGAMGSPLRKENDLLELIKTGKPPLPFLYVSCGTEDRGLEANRRLVQALYAAKIPYEYRELPGAHTWYFWDDQVQQLLEVLRRIGFTRSVERP